MHLRKGWLCTECGAGHLSWWKAVNCHKAPVRHILVTLESGVVKPVLENTRTHRVVRPGEAGEDDTFGLISDLTGDI